jgi:hypothetical protein
MAHSIEMPGVTKSESTLLVMFLPSVNRRTEPIDQSKWETATLELLATRFGGATAFPKGRGVWRDDEQGGKLIFDETIVIHCYTSIDVVEGSLSEFHAFLVRLGRETDQGAVGFVLDRTYMEIRFPLPTEEVPNG